MGRSPELKNPIFVALDIDSDDQALSLAKKICDYVGGFKVGPRLTYKYGAKLVKSLAEVGPVFVDNKYHDIPNTVLTALRTTFESGASFATVHASNGPEALRQIKDLEFELSSHRPFQILSVTVLTSFSDKNLPMNWQAAPSREHVKFLAAETIKSGLSGIVCSAEEVLDLREQHPGAFLVTPGIRLPTDSPDDQARVMGPAQAMAAGASALVVGRPIVSADDPIAAAKNFAAAIK